MQKRKTLLLKPAIATGLAMVAGTALAGRPLAIDDADPVDAGQFEFEAGAGYVHDDDCKHWDFPFGVTYGVLPRVEVGLGFGGQLEERTERSEDSGVEMCTREHGIGDLVIGAKWQFLEKCPLGARHALAPSVKFPTADDEKELGSGKTDYDLTWVASRAIGEKSGVHVNVGYSWLGGPDEDVLLYGVALDYQILESVQWVAEVFAEKVVAGGEETAVQYNAGFRWNPVANVTLDIAGGSKLAGEAPDFNATAGLTWAFGFDGEDSK